MSAEPLPLVRCDRRSPHGPHEHELAGARLRCRGIRKATGPARRGPKHLCAGGCGVRVFRADTYCGGCRPVGGGGESILAYLRRQQGKCVVCGGPFPDGSGCEFCPGIDP